MKTLPCSDNISRKLGISVWFLQQTFYIKNRPIDLKLVTRKDIYNIFVMSSKDLFFANYRGYMIKRKIFPYRVGKIYIFLPCLNLKKYHS